MQFEAWLAECRDVIIKVLGFDARLAGQMIEGADVSIYRAKFDRGLTPQQCIDDEVAAWNE